MKEEGRRWAEQIRATRDSLPKKAFQNLWRGREVTLYWCLVRIPPPLSASRTCGVERSGVEGRADGPSGPNPSRPSGRFPSASVRPRETRGDVGEKGVLQQCPNSKLKAVRPSVPPSGIWSLDSGVVTTFLRERFCNGRRNKLGGERQSTASVIRIEARKWNYFE